MAAEKPTKGEPALIKERFFHPPETADGKWRCKICEGALTWRGPKYGYSIFVQHMTGTHSATWRRDLDELKSNKGGDGKRSHMAPIFFHRVLCETFLCVFFAS